jgi:hypothetical protein
VLGSVCDMVVVVVQMEMFERMKEVSSAHKDRLRKMPGFPRLVHRTGTF